jgi:hypothetical protein
MQWTLLGGKTLGVYSAHHHRDSHYYEEGGNKSLLSVEEHASESLEWAPEEIIYMLHKEIGVSNSSSTLLTASCTRRQPS